MSKLKSEIVTIENCSRQALKFQIRPPKSDFFLHEQQVRLSPGKRVEVPKDYLIWAQVENCKARGLIKTTIS
jgi:hypothetical protein